MLSGAAVDEMKGALEIIRGLKLGPDGWEFVDGSLGEIEHAVDAGDESAAARARKAVSFAEELARVAEWDSPGPVVNIDQYERGRLDERISIIGRKIDRARG